LNYFSANLSTKATFWTSGSSQGVLSETNYNWCSTKEKVSRSVVASGFPESIWANRCIKFTFSNLNRAENVLNDAACNTALKVFCEK